MAKIKAETDPKKVAAMLQPTTVFRNLGTARRAATKSPRISKYGIRISTSDAKWAACRNPDHPENDINLLAFTIGNYRIAARNAINKGPLKDGIPESLRKYLLALVDYAEGNGPGNDAKLSELWKAAKESVKGLTESAIESNFGEILAPIFAVRWVAPFTKGKTSVVSGSTLYTKYGTAGAAIKYILFPDVQNFPLFDFFIADGYIFGFSVKSDGSSNPLKADAYSKRFGAIWLETLLEDKKTMNAARFKNEIALLKAINNYKTPGGSLIAMSMQFGELKNKTPHSDLSKIWSKTMGKTLNPAGDGAIFLKELGETIQKSSLSSSSPLFDKEGKAVAALDLKAPQSAALLNFLLYFGVGRSTKERPNLETWKNNPSMFEVRHLSSVAIQYVCDTNIPQITELTRSLFPDLNIVKVKINTKGIPHFTLQIHTSIGEELSALAKKIHGSIKQGAEYGFRSKSSFGRDDDKLGIQL